MDKIGEPDSGTMYNYAGLSLLWTSVKRAGAADDDDDDDGGGRSDVEGEADDGIAVLPVYATLHPSQPTPPTESGGTWSHGLGSVFLSAPAAGSKSS